MNHRLGHKTTTSVAVPIKTKEEPAVSSRTTEVSHPLRAQDLLGWQAQALALVNKNSSYVSTRTETEDSDSKIVCLSDLMYGNDPRRAIHFLYRRPDNRTGKNVFLNFMNNSDSTRVFIAEGMPRITVLTEQLDEARTEGTWSGDCLIFDLPTCPLGYGPRYMPEVLAAVSKMNYCCNVWVFWDQFPNIDEISIRVEHWRFFEIECDQRIGRILDLKPLDAQTVRERVHKVEFGSLDEPCYDTYWMMRTNASIEQRFSRLVDKVGQFRNSGNWDATEAILRDNQDILTGARIGSMTESVYAGRNSPWGIKYMEWIKAVAAR